MSEPQVESRVEGRLLHVVLNRPEKRNALTPDMLEAVAAAVRTADVQEAVLAFVQKRPANFQGK
jgi:enoyl-CoA hydratase/carnithine racemase